MNFIYISIAVTVGFWVSKIYSRTQIRLREDELLEEIRKLCNELLKIKDRTIVIKSLKVSRTKGPNRVVVTTIPEGEESVKMCLECEANVPYPYARNYFRTCEDANLRRIKNVMTVPKWCPRIKGNKKGEELE